MLSLKSRMRGDGEKIVFRIVELQMKNSNLSVSPAGKIATNSSYFSPETDV